MLKLWSRCWHLVSGADLLLPVHIAHPDKLQAAAIVKGGLDAQMVAVPEMRQSEWICQRIGNQTNIKCEYSTCGLRRFYSTGLRSTSHTWQSSPTCPHQCRFFCWPLSHRGRTCPLDGLYIATVVITDNRDVRISSIGEVCTSQLVTWLVVSCSSYCNKICVVIQPKTGQ